MAVLLVMILHFITMDRGLSQGSDLEWLIYRVMRQGWIGVDLFFVLSGFLITGILLDNKNAPSYFKSFYVRRVLRIFPLYYAYLLFLLLVIYPLAYGRAGVAEQEKIDLVRDNVGWFLLYASNIKQALMGASFHANTSHLWSLAIEEQFYIVWPFLVWLIPTKRLPLLCGALVVGALLVRIAMVNSGLSYDAIRSFTLGRLDGLAIGSLLAYYVRYRPPTSPRKLTLVAGGLAVVLGPVFITGQPWTFAFIVTVGYSILSAYFGLVVLKAYTDKPDATPSGIRRVLGFFGKYCYALYMLHPLMAAIFLKLAGRPPLIWGSQLPWQAVSLLACTLLSIAAAMLSWRLLEQPILRLKRYFPY